MIFVDRHLMQSPVNQLRCQFGLTFGITKSECHVADSINRYPAPIFFA